MDAAIAAGALPGGVVYLLEIDSVVNDEARDRRIPFAAGDEFTLTINELGAQFGSPGPSNGARWQGLRVQAVPEPSLTALFAAVVAIGVASARF